MKMDKGTKRRISESGRDVKKINSTKKELVLKGPSRKITDFFCKIEDENHVLNSSNLPPSTSEQADSPSLGSLPSEIFNKETVEDMTEHPPIMAEDIQLETKPSSVIVSTEPNRCIQTANTIDFGTLEVDDARAMDQSVHFPHPQVMTGEEKEASLRGLFNCCLKLLHRIRNRTEQDVQTDQPQKLSDNPNFKATDTVGSHAPPEVLDGEKDLFIVGCAVDKANEEKRVIKPLKVRTDKK